MADFTMTDDHQFEDKSRVPYLDTCCCIFPLKTGVKLIAFGELIVCSALFVFTIVVGTYYEVSGEDSKIFDRETARELLYLHYSTLLDVIFAVYLLIGIYKNRAHYAKTWCLAQSVHLFVSFSVTIYNAVVLSTAKEFGTKFIVENFFTTGIDVYFLLVVYSYYRSTKEYCRNACPTA
ncbi:uncharacterized protein [Halyomorpha halys]|uniref:uncharacterized protein n=1 Tax=Halyomorpha halys TaxID=286706 RepID=UPI0006D4E2ED|nr:uncharacterized protein LOC106688816 [Halyomorpha halys]